MKRILSLLLVLSLLLPVLSLAEEDEDDDFSVEEIVEDVMLDDDGNEILMDEDTGEKIILSSADQDSLDKLDEAWGLQQTEEIDPADLELNQNLPDHIINILLIGLDVKGTKENKLLTQQEKYAKRADVQMVCSIDLDDGSVKLTSIARNTYVEIPGRKDTLVANSYGHANYDANGKYKSWTDTPENCVRTVNHNFELNIQYYIAINFYGVVQIIEALGGSDIDLTKVEARAINSYLAKNRREISKTYDDKQGKRDKLKVTAGVQHLDGLQSLMYARLRSIDSDFVRTGRTRHLLDCLLKSTVSRIRNHELNVVDLLEQFIDYPVTNITPSTLVSLANSVVNSELTSNLDDASSMISEFRVPSDGNWFYDTVNGSSVTKFKDKQADVEAIHEFIYGRYYPSVGE